jgi:DNA-binding HxlR family transcriptional regulator
MGKLRHIRHNDSPSCAVEATLSLIDGKWKGVILHQLSSGTLRFNELHRLLPRISPRILATQLREMEEDGLLNRRVYAQVPPKVEYSLTARGESLRPILDSLRLWGDANFDFEGNRWRQPG